MFLKLLSAFLAGSFLVSLPLFPEEENSSNTTCGQTQEPFNDPDNTEPVQPKTDEPTCHLIPEPGLSSPNPSVPLAKVDPADLKDYVLAPFISEFEELIPLKTGEALIVLNDHSRWIVRHFSNEEENLYLNAPWQKGDDIRLLERNNLDRKGFFTLKNTRTQSGYPVDFDTSSLKNICAYSIEKLDSNGYFLSTDNHIDWAISWTNSWTSWSWRPKDVILINKSNLSDKHRYLLINLSTQEATPAKIVEWK
ncbi:MAG: hypothetical protein WC371_00040 [Parachlamydiales bacterium]|jgi:hypothetical protein